MTRYRLDTGGGVRAREPVEIDSSALREGVQRAWHRGEALALSGDARGGLAWLDRAHRLAPSDQNLLFSLAVMRLRAGRPLEAITLFEGIARDHGVREAWAGLAASCLAAGLPDRAASALAAALSRNMADPGLLSLASRVTASAGLPGWCAIAGEGFFRVGPAATGIRAYLDGAPVALTGDGQDGFALPETWRDASELAVTLHGVHLAGSPISIAAMLRLEGFVARSGNVIEGWAWHPGAPEIDPELRLADEHGRETGRLVARDVSDQIEGSSPLARPRVFTAAVAEGAWVCVRSPTSRDLPGSPLPPGLVRRLPSPGSGRAAPAQRPARRPGTDIVIPVYRGLEVTMHCLASVLAAVTARARIWVVDDGSPDRALAAALRAMQREGRIGLIASCDAAPGRNLGFPAAVNAGLRAASGRDVVLLNSDTLVAGDWLAMLEDAAYSAADIGTATPFSNDATILSYPERNVPNPAPDLAGARRLASLAAQANAGLMVEIPTAHGFCMFIRHDCLASVGGLEEGLFAQGYGEENDFCERARALGWRHVAVPGAYVAHAGGGSFGAMRTPLLRRNLGILGRLHPGYHERIQAFKAQDPLAPSRRRLDAARWKAARQGAGAVLLVTHGGGGGTARIVAERAADILARGLRPIVLAAQDGLCRVGDGDGGFPNLCFRLPAELPALIDLLRDDGPVSAELHHLLGHDHSITRLFREFGIPYEIWVHDYAWLCPRISLVTGTGRYCGEPPPAACEICVRRWGRAIDDPISPTTLRARSASDFAGARQIIVASDDVAKRLRRHFPALRPRVAPWQEDGPAQPPRPLARTGRLRVAIAGGIGVEKGYDVLLACAEDAAARALDITFVLVGYSIDDDKLEATGRVFITGPYKLAEAEALIRAQQAHIALLPSIWPETWSYALSDMWQAGLSAAVFDIGTPAERVRRGGRGWVLPLGLPPSRINDALLQLANA